MAQVVQLGEWEMRFWRAGESMNAREENREGNTEQWCGVCQKRKYIHLVSSLHTVGGHAQTEEGRERLGNASLICLYDSLRRLHKIKVKWIKLGGTIETLIMYMLI